MNVITLPLPWLELAIVIALAGALIVSRVRDAIMAWRLGMVFTGATLACTVMASLGFYVGGRADVDALWAFHIALSGQQYLRIDELNAPLLPMIALLHFLTALATGRTKMRRFSLSWSLTADAIRLATFASADPWMLIALLALETLPPYVELINRGKPTRVYVVHMVLFVGLLALGWTFVDPTRQSSWGAVLLLVAVLIRCGAVPAHCWITDWFEHASFGNALLYVTPLAGVYAAVRLVLPVAPDWVLHSLGLVSLVTGVYTAAMAVVQREARRFFAYLFISHASLVLVGLELHTAITLTGSLSLWISVALSLAGFGLTLRALEARFGRISLVEFHGLYDHSPALAVCFLMTGLASVGFPGTVGFVAAELLIQGAVEASPYVGLAVAVVAMINGIAVVKAYLRLFTGARHASTVSLNIVPREQFAVLTLAVLILGGGIFPQAHIAARHRAATLILQQRQQTSEPVDEVARSSANSELEMD
jgi:NADH-quinone oxidoreductase subunit M